PVSGVVSIQQKPQHQVPRVSIDLHAYSLHPAGDRFEYRFGYSAYLRAVLHQLTPVAWVLLPLDLHAPLHLPGKNHRAAGDRAVCTTAGAWLKRNLPAARLSSVIRAMIALALTAAAAGAQAPKVGDINFYGLHKVTPQKLLAKIDIRPGAPLPPSKGDLEERIEEIPGVVQARVQAICCEGASAILFIGVEEKGAPHFDYHGQPSGTAALPQEIIDAYHEFLGAVERAARAGNTAEDLTAGHSRMADPSAAA